MHCKRRRGANEGAPHKHSNWAIVFSFFPFLSFHFISLFAYDDMTLVEKKMQRKGKGKMGNRQGPGRPMSSWEGEYLILIMNII
jgi:hypothetical protein